MAEPNWRIEIINNSESICGYSIKEFNSGNINWLNLIHPRDKEQILKESKKLEKKPTELIQEYRIFAKDGSVQWVEDRKFSFFDENNVFIGIDGVIFNITEQKKAELFKKDLTDLQINVEWHNLPDHRKGLRGYYKEYGLGINNESYKVRVSALSEGEFFPAAEDNLKEYLLFEESDEDRLRIADDTTFDELDLKAFNIKPDYNLSLPSTFNNEVRSGYLKLELTTPSVGFGHDDYSNISNL